VDGVHQPFVCAAGGVFLVGDVDCGVLGAAEAGGGVLVCVCVAGGGSGECVDGSAGGLQRVEAGGFDDASGAGDGAVRFAGVLCVAWDGSAVAGGGCGG